MGLILTCSPDYVTPLSSVKVLRRRIGAIAISRCAQGLADLSMPAGRVGLVFCQTDSTLPCFALELAFDTFCPSLHRQVSLTMTRYSICIYFRIEEARLFLSSDFFSRSSWTRLAMIWAYSLAASFEASAALRLSASLCLLCCMR